MKMRLLGTRMLDFRSNDNLQIRGTQLFVAYEAENVTGEMTDKLFIREDFDLPPIKPGENIEVAFNNRGKPESIKSASKQTSLANQ